MRLIDADAIIYEYERVFKTKFVKESVIDKMPTIDAVPVVHGLWDDAACGFYICSECDQISEFAFDYCPYRGAKMDEEADT